MDAELFEPGQDGLADDAGHVGFVGLGVHAFDGVDVLDLGHLGAAESLLVALDHVVEQEVDGVAAAVGDEGNPVLVADFPAHAGDADRDLARAADLLGVVITLDDLHPPELGDVCRDAQQEEHSDDLDADFGFEQGHVGREDAANIADAGPGAKCALRRSKNLSSKAKARVRAPRLMPRAAVRAEVP